MTHGFFCVKFALRQDAWKRTQARVNNKTIKIGGASGYWGESAMATPQLLTVRDLDYLVYDYLAEITMSILARAKAKDPTQGYATDFVTAVMQPHLETIAKTGVKVISNAGGVNPESCVAAIRALIKEKGLKLRVAMITGDDFMDRIDSLKTQNLTDMFSGTPFPATDKILSVNAYLGAFPIAKALAAGADIVITGRCVDSAVTLGACIYEFGWGPKDWDLLASGSLAGHILECGPQATGGNFTDWMLSGDISNIGYPVAEIKPDGTFTLTKPGGTGGVVNIGTVTEQMLYEIGDPRHYALPDIVCDFSKVTLTQTDKNRVEVSQAIGQPAPEGYKTCVTYLDGFRAGTYVTLYGMDADKKSHAFGQAALTRARKRLYNSNLGDFTEINFETLGTGHHMGHPRPSNEVVMKAAVKHPDIKGTAIFLKEVAAMGLATPPGLSGFTGVRGKPSPVVRLHAYLTPKSDVTVKIDIEGKIITHRDIQGSEISPTAAHTPPAIQILNPVNVPLISLAYGRSGDKGNKANIGLIAREPEYLPYMWAAVTDDFIAHVFAHFMEKNAQIERFYLPGSHAMNILIDDILGGGGVASLRNDAQGKGYAQILLAQSIPVSRDIEARLS